MLSAKMCVCVCVWLVFGRIHVSCPPTNFHGNERITVSLSRAHTIQSLAQLAITSIHLFRRLYIHNHTHTAHISIVRIGKHRNVCKITHSVPVTFHSSCSLFLSPSDCVHIVALENVAADGWMDGRGNLVRFRLETSKTNTIRSIQTEKFHFYTLMHLLLDGGGYQTCMVSIGK